MVLSGTLREFILADVFQLLTQQKITGKLILNSGKSDGFVIFKNGQVIYAEKDNEKLLEKTINYINTVSNKSLSNTNELISSFENDNHSLSIELIKRGFISKEDLSSLAEATIEDICCSLFLWKSGSYRFASLRTVDEFAPLNQTFPVENIVMEAMRRSDEWYRMQEFVNKDVVFIRTSKELNININAINPLKNPQEFLLARIDGTSPVSEIVKDSCLSEYKIYEALYSLAINNSVIPLSEQYTRSVQAALEQKKREQSSSPVHSIMAIGAVLCTTVILIITASFLVNGLILSQAIKESKSFKEDTEKQITLNKLNVAHLYHHTAFGKTTDKVEQLFSFKMITNNDIHIIKANSLTVDNNTKTAEQ